MRVNKTPVACVILTALSGCSSPPEPAQPKWNKPGTVINITLPQWSENRDVLGSPGVDDRWTMKITFNPDAIYPSGVWYAVAHSERVTVNAPDGERYFRVKAWLRKHGYSGVVSFNPTRRHCLTCNTTEIEFYR